MSYHYFLTMLFSPSFVSSLLCFSTAGANRWLLGVAGYLTVVELQQQQIIMSLIWHILLHFFFFFVCVSACHIHSFTISSTLNSVGEGAAFRDFITIQCQYWKWTNGLLYRRFAAALQLTHRPKNRSSHREDVHYARLPIQLSSVRFNV